MADTRRLRLGMVGGGQGAFIGAVHRIAARRDDQYELVAGALSSDPVRAAASVAELHIAPDRAYSSFEVMAQSEAARPDGIDVVAVVTPNHLHFAACKAFLEAGIHVICDKPVTTTLDDAESLAGIVARSGKLFVLTHNYTGYPMVRQARAMVADGLIGALRVVQVEYAQDWLTEPAEMRGIKGAEWRTDPARAGSGGAIGDIGTHAYNLAAFVTGCEPETLLADLSAMVEGRRLDDNAHILLRYAGRARGMMWASQVAVGRENHLALRVYGTKGGLEWSQEEPNVLRFAPYGEPPRLLTRGGPALGPAATQASRVPAGHPEGYLDAFANLYSDAAAAIRVIDAGAGLAGFMLPGISDGVRGLRFIEACLRSHRETTFTGL